MDVVETGLTDVADEVFSFESDAAKQRDIAVGMLPRSSCKKASSISREHRTPRLALTKALDLNAPPRRGLLRALADCCQPKDSSDVAQAELEKSKLLLLSSRDGRELYDSIVIKMSCGIPEILAMFPTCNPPFSLILGGTAQLMPRYYSVSSSPLNDPQEAQHCLYGEEHSTKLPSNSGGQGKGNGPVTAMRPILRQGLCTSGLSVCNA